MERFDCYALYAAIKLLLNPESASKEFPQSGKASHCSGVKVDKRSITPSPRSLTSQVTQISRTIRKCWLNFFRSNHKTCCVSHSMNWQKRRQSQKSSSTRLNENLDPLLHRRHRLDSTHHNSCSMTRKQIQYPVEKSISKAGASNTSPW